LTTTLRAYYHSSITFLSFLQPVSSSLRVPQSWVEGSVEDWAMEGHRLAQTVAYGNLGTQNPAPITAAYERQAAPMIELELEKAGVRLAHLLDDALR
jgi:hypothetical protein